MLAIVTISSTFARLGAGQRAMAFYDDDFFYYLKIALNLAAGHGSTFDGIHHTNGYQPLWLLVITALVKVAPLSAALFVILCLMCVSIMATYALSLATFNRVAQNEFVASLAAAFIAFSAIRLIHGGMEVVLTIPLALALCCFRTRPRFAWTARNAAIYGLLASLVVLSRLDSLLLIAPLFLMELFWPQNIRHSFRFFAAAALALGLLPVFIYFVINLHYFGVLLPISGLAKQQRLHPGFNAEPFRTLIFWLSPYLRLLIVAPTVAAIAGACGLVGARGWKRLESQYRPLATALLAFPILQCLALSWLSDWPIFEWYMYSFLLGQAGAALIFFSQDIRLPRAAVTIFTSATTGVLVLLMLVYAAGRLRSAHRPEESLYRMYNSAIDIANFAQNHPGIYAMGDRGAMPGYLLHDPVIQLEGLVMDKAYLENIREQRSLNDVLRNYGVTYYIATDPQPIGGCYTVREPIQAGPDSRSMHGTFCSEPVAHMVSFGEVTDIFDLHDNPARVVK